MATRKLILPSGEIVETEVVEIEEISEKPIIIKLSDGTVLRFRVDIAEVCRYDKERDAEGFPLYHVKSGNVITVLECPDHLREKIE